MGIESEFERVFSEALLASWDRRLKELPEGDEARSLALIGYVFGAEDALLSIGILTRALAVKVGRQGIQRLLETASPALIERVRMNAPPRIDLSATPEEGSDESPK